MRYLVVLENGPTSVGAYVPDLPGCVAVGETVEEVTGLIREAIDREYLVFFEHDPHIAAGYIRERDGKRFVEQVL